LRHKGFLAAEFASDLFKVATRSSDTSRDYSPIEFFNRTYLTEGLRNLIGGVVDRLSGDPNASPVVNLQTNFGGGKTHSMLALWHFAGRRPTTPPKSAAEHTAEERHSDSCNI
jgi:predicted AAA+ superfamily ATPase